MKVKEKIKETWKGYGEPICMGLWMGVIYASGMFVGQKICDLQFNTGLARLISVKPEIATLITEAFEELKKK